MKFKSHNLSTKTRRSPGELQSNIGRHVAFEAQYVVHEGVNLGVDD